MSLPAAIANRLRCWSFYFFGCYRGTGGRLTSIASDWSEIRLEIPLSWRTRNYVGTMFGGSLYGAVDPIYMLMLIHRLGPEYLVWDKSATIQFKKPGKETLHAHFLVSDEELAAIRSALESQRSVDRTYTVELVDSAGVVCASIEKILYIRRR
jgi:acyl-coenzyme A thioesterase PaaI-like protein